jgi:hypothetical protein
MPIKADEANSKMRIYTLSCIEKLELMKRIDGTGKGKIRFLLYRESFLLKTYISNHLRYVSASEPSYYLRLYILYIISVTNKEYRIN